VSFTDANTGTVVGGASILRTTNGGATWVAQASGTANALYGVSFTDTNNGTVVGDNGTILRTTDAGETWVAQASGTTAWLNGVSFADANHGIAVGIDTTILRTTDGGATWVAQASSNSAWLHGVSLTDATTGTAVGDELPLSRGRILRMTDVSEYADSCDPFCARVDECSLKDRIPNCAPSCSCTVNEGALVSAECETAVADIDYCVADLPSCDQVEAWWDMTPADSYPCKAADDERDSACY
jgi:hypothetical protein